MSASCPVCHSVLDHPSQEVVSVGDLQVDLGARTCMRSGRKIKLTSREFSALVFMMQNPGRALTRTDIAQNAWGLHFEGLTNQVDVYINYLRNKVDEGSRPLIHTVRGIGYKIAVEDAA